MAILKPLETSIIQRTVHLHWSAIIITSFYQLPRPPPRLLAPGLGLGLVEVDLVPVLVVVVLLLVEVGLAPVLVAVVLLLMVLEDVVGEPGLDHESAEQGLVSPDPVLVLLVLADGVGEPGLDHESAGQVLVLAVLCPGLVLAALGLGLVLGAPGLVLVLGVLRLGLEEVDPTPLALVLAPRLVVEQVPVLEDEAGNPVLGFGLASEFVF